MEVHISIIIIIILLLLYANIITYNYIIYIIYDISLLTKIIIIVENKQSVKKKFIIT